MKADTGLPRVSVQHSLNICFHIEDGKLCDAIRRIVTGGDDEGTESLRIAHDRLTDQLDGQVEQSHHLDEKAMGTLRLSLAFSGVAAAAVYYLSRTTGDTAGTIDNPATYAALAFGLVSVVFSFLTIFHTRLETGVQPERLNEASGLRPDDLLGLLVTVYPRYIRRNDSRINTDTVLLSIAQATLILAILATVAAVLLYLDTRSVGFYAIIATTAIVSGIIGGATTIAFLSYRSESEPTSETSTDGRQNDHEEDVQSTMDGTDEDADGNAWESQE